MIQHADKQALLVWGSQHLTIHDTADGSGDVTETNHIWKRDNIGTFVPSPVAWKGRVYLVRDRGEVECLDPATGKTIWSETFPSNRTGYYASPLIANGIRYAPREDGVVFVASVADDNFKPLAENNIACSFVMRNTFIA